MSMFTKRFVLLAVVLVTLNLTLWFAAPGMALRKAIIKQLFGPAMVRAEVIKKDGSDWLLARGVITNVTSSQLTLKEADGKIQPITLSSSTRVIHLGQRLSLSALAPRWRVLVEWPLNGPARSVDVERIPPSRHTGSG
jgi:hypothetical protein